MRYFDEAVLINPTEVSHHPRRSCMEYLLENWHLILFLYVWLGVLIVLDRHTNNALSPDNNALKHSDHVGNQKHISHQVSHFVNQSK